MYWYADLDMVTWCLPWTDFNIVGDPVRQGFVNLKDCTCPATSQGMSHNLGTKVIHSTYVAIYQSLID